MHKHGNILFTFIVLFILSFLLFIFPNKGITEFFEQITFPVRKVIFGVVHKPDINKNEIEILREENSKLIAQLAHQKELEKENKALHDQFQTSSIFSKKMLPANVVGMEQERFILDKGSVDGVATGQIVVVKDNLAGKILKVSPRLSILTLLTDKNTSLTVETVKTSVRGLLTGDGSGGMILDGVVLSDKLEKNDILVTKGDMTSNDSGYPPHLVVGKMVSINKKASNLFQTAKVKSLIDFGKLETVFIVK